MSIFVSRDLGVGKFYYNERWNGNKRGRDGRLYTRTTRTQRRNTKIFILMEFSLFFFLSIHTIWLYTVKRKWKIKLHARHCVDNVALIKYVTYRPCTRCGGSSAERFRGLVCDPSGFRAHFRSKNYYYWRTMRVTKRLKRVVVGEKNR